MAKEELAKWLTVEEAADMAGISKAAIYNRIPRQETFKTEKKGGILIEKKSFLKWLKTRRQP